MRMFPLRLPLLTVAAAVLLPLMLPQSARAQSLRGSPTSVNRMYYHAVDHAIYFYKTSEGLRRAADEGRFLRLTGNGDYTVHRVSHPYVRPATRTFVERLASQYRRACGERLVVTSASRPQEMRLRNSHSRSVHPTGIAVDLRKPRNGTCRSWLRRTLLQLEGAGLIEATEEHNPPHFHVAVFPAPYQRYVERRGGAVYVAARSETDQYTVRRGDSLWAIARRHDTTVDRLRAANGLRGSRIRAGQELVIPASR